MNLSFDETRFTHEALCNTWENATVSFDGNNLAFDECVNLNTTGLHEYLITRTDGLNTDTFTFNIEVQPSYSFTQFQIANTVSPSTIMEFHNDSPDEIDVDFSVEPNLTGLVMAEVLNNREPVPAGGSILVQVEFYTAAGFVVRSGQIPEATIFAREKDSSGVIIASATVFHVPHETVVPTVSQWGLMVMTLLLLTAGTVVLGRRRRPAAA